MATSPATVVPSAAIDTTGLSVVTSLPSSDPRAGAIYNPHIIAAAAPVWFHPMKNGGYLMAMSRLWSPGTPAARGVYSAYTESTVPSWTVIDGSAGTVANLTNGLPIPMTTPVTSAVLRAGCSKPQEILWLLHSVQIAGVHQAIIQYYDISASGTVTHRAEEVLPSTSAVVFDCGIQYLTPFMLVYGRDSSGNLYRIRKNWARIGAPNNVPSWKPQTQGYAWEYYTGTGYSADPTELAPIQKGLLTTGPVSFGYWNDIVVMSVVLGKTVASGIETVTAADSVISSMSVTDRVGRFWVSRSGSPWVPSTVTEIDLGSTSDGSYLGGGIQIQSQVGANPALLASGVNAGLLYLTSTKVSASGGHSLQNTWGTYPVSLVG